MTYFPTNIFKQILSYNDMTIEINKKKLIKQLNLFDKDWYDEYFYYMIDLYQFSDLTKFEDFEEVCYRYEEIEGDLPFIVLDNEFILNALILIGN